MGGPVEGRFSVAFDPLDGSNIVDTNFTVGTIFGVWLGDKLTRITGRNQVVAANLRATSDNPDYAKLIDYYVNEKYTLRYTRGMVPDIIVKEKRIFTNVASTLTKAKLRLLFEVAPLGSLIEKAGGYNSDSHHFVLDKVINNVDERTRVVYESNNEIIEFEETLNGKSTQGWWSC
uniref:Fructose-1-6-bisphosphatase class 1 C-terminal domain-containing protein n=1 Tax=Cajanus cajan TaxID=3821 RepID=A0A151SYC3_CAJCA|nr:hypothetical protein KK1_015246 [Cajanus cajan]